MKAKACIFYPACKYQKALAQTQVATPSQIQCWADRVGCDDEKDDMHIRCRLFREINVESSDALRPCPICLGKGEICIADYVDRAAIPDRYVRCPVCEGLGVIAAFKAGAETETRNGAKQDPENSDRRGEPKGGPL